jgi:ATP-dependent RNA helicase RhlE
VTFSKFELDPSLLKGIREMGFVRPTPIQSDAIPPAMQGKDLLACASTGSGKTAAFLLPILDKLINRPRRTTRALVLTPTRELASQIVEQLDAMAVHTPVTAAVIIGGVGMGPQEHAFRTGTDVLVATPGRLLDHMKAPYAKLDRIEYLVLDEADRMLDMGFLPDIRRILKSLPAKRQTLFFSATMPRPIALLAGEMLKNPATINLERTSMPATGISQALYPVPQELKSALFLELLNRGDMKEALVFTRTKHRANRLAEFLSKNGVKCERIHGNRSQKQRTEALAGFKSGKYRVLVATDIAARGIDVVELGHVVNFDVPPAPDDYIHRVGRTGRADATGDAFTFFSPQEDAEIKDIERAIKRKLPRVVVEGFDYSARPQQKFEVPLAERIAAIRKKKADDRARSKAKADRGRSNGTGGADTPYRENPRAGGESSSSSRRNNNRRRRSR